MLFAILFASSGDGVLLLECQRTTCGCSLSLLIVSHRPSQQNGDADNLEREKKRVDHRSAAIPVARILRASPELGCITIANSRIL